MRSFVVRPLQVVGAFNNENGLTGSLFQQKAKAKHLSDEAQLFVCFQYVHQNPMKGKLERCFGEWPYSSLPEYLGLRKGTLPNKEMAKKFLDLPNTTEDFRKEMHQVISDHLIKEIT